ncbi:hypothetical protein OG780_09855 [Streptomyces sp. NBC_00386]|uniref:hypothetical protein n=1 Tax=Streptomyces sp. NBC_00386 TaxID=2975734 RepID=UPI002E227A82
MNARNEDTKVTVSPAAVLGQLDRVHIRLPHLPVEELDDRPQLQRNPVGNEQQPHPPGGQPLLDRRLDQNSSAERSPRSSPHTSSSGRPSLTQGRAVRRRAEVQHPRVAREKCLELRLGLKPGTFQRLQFLAQDEHRLISRTPHSHDPAPAASMSFSHMPEP